MDETRKPLEYDRSIKPAVTRGQFRLLLLLMLVQVVMTAQSTYAPNVMQWVRARWAEHQALVARAAQEKRVAAMEQQAGVFAQPADTVVWEEDPVLAAPLLANGHQPVRVFDLTSSPAATLIPAGAHLPVPPALVDLLLNVGPGYDDGLVFLHLRHSPHGTERLVTVWATGRLDLSSSITNVMPPTREPIEGSIAKVHGLMAMARPLSSAPATAVVRMPQSVALWLRPYGQQLDMPVHWLPPDAPEQPTSIRVDWREQFRVYAGQPDPADPSHFTIDYAIDGARSTIDGYLDNGSLTLTPRQGKVSGGRWYPHAR